MMLLAAQSVTPDADARPPQTSVTMSPAHSDEVKTDCVVVAIFSDGTLSPGALRIDAASGGEVSRWVSAGDISGKLGQTLILHGLGGVQAPRVCLLGVGARSTFGAAPFERALTSLFRTTRVAPIRSLHIDFFGLFEAVNVSSVVERAVLAHSRSLASDARSPDRRPLSLGCLSMSGVDSEACEIDRAVAVGRGQRLARTLVELAPSQCAPARFADEVRRVLEAHPGYDVEVMDHRACGRRGLHALSALGNASSQDALLILVRPRNCPAPRRVLLGSGLTFDGGGLNFDARREPHWMKSQKAGPAVALGAYVAAVEGGFANDVGLALVVAESVLDGKSLRPGDVLKTLSGHTVEVSNVRNVLRLASMDALAYCRRDMRGCAIVHVASLVDEQGFGLGRHAIPFVTNSDALASELLHAAERTTERLWRMPLLDGSEARLESTFADKASQGGYAAAGIAATRLLSIAAQGNEWAHLETGGTAWEGAAAGEATGRGVRLICEWLRARATA